MPNTFPDRDKPVVSLVVIGRNEGAKLRRCFESLQRIEPLNKGYELIYVDSDSSDGSSQLAASFGARVIQLNTHPLSAALARNAGWRSAAGKFAQFIDGDCELHPDYIDKALSAFANPHVAVVCGHVYEKHPHSSVYQRVLDIDWRGEPGLALSCGGIAMIRMELLEQVGGFDIDLAAGEEPDLCRRLRERGYRILYIDQPMAWHDLSMNRFSKYWDRCSRTGRAYAEVSDRYRGTSDPLWRREYLRSMFWGFFWPLLAVVGVLMSLYRGSIYPVIGVMALLLLAAVRTVLKARRRSDSWRTLFLYGIHSQLQHIPIMWGQICYRMRERERDVR